MLEALKNHWPEYLIEAAGLGFFMISACFFGTLLEFPGSPVHRALPDPFSRRILMGAAMGLTAIAIIYSPWGKRSGAHVNPATTIMFYRLGKLEKSDALFYILAQFAGGTLGVVFSAVILGPSLMEPPVRYVVTEPGSPGPFWAFAAEVLITFLLMAIVLIVTNIRSLNRLTGLFVGFLVAIYIAFEGPISGMSMNPARTFASAFPANYFPAIWIYFTAPFLGMLLAAELHVRRNGLRSVLCAKLHHDNPARCIFRCGWGM